MSSMTPEQLTRALEERDRRNATADSDGLTALAVAVLIIGLFMHGHGTVAVFLMLIAGLCAIVKSIANGVHDRALQKEAVRHQKLADEAAEQQRQRLIAAEIAAEEAKEAEMRQRNKEAVSLEELKQFIEQLKQEKPYFTARS